MISAADDERLVSRRPSLVDDLLSGPRWDEAFAGAVASRAKTVASS